MADATNTATVRPETAIRFVKGRGPVAQVWARLVKKKLAMVCLAWIVIVFGLGLLAPVLPIRSFSQQNLDASRQPPSLQHPLGTDDLGRDMLSRIIWGAQTALLVATVPLAISMSIGLVVGMAAGYFRGWIDWLLMRLCEYLAAFPDFLLLVFLAATLKPVIVNFVRDSFGPAIGQPGLWRTGLVDYLAILILLSFIGWPGLARFVRGQVLSLREKEFIEAARAVGVPEARVFFTHLFPNVVGYLIVIVSSAMAAAITAEAALSFLGFGITPPFPSWGSMISGATGFLRTPYWWIIVFPCVVVASLLYAFIYLGDSLSDAVNPQTR